jgi:hypothetical protein
MGAASLPPPQPRVGHAASGAGSPGGSRARNGHSTALFTCECQSFLDNVIAGLGQIGAWNDAGLKWNIKLAHNLKAVGSNPGLDLFKNVPRRS